MTRRDVARLAGTSEAVVSYVLNGGPRSVAPATKERVLTAIGQLGYRPNALARSLRTNRTMTFGLVVPDNSNPFFAELARSVEDAGFDHGYTMLLGNAMDDDDREATYVRALLDRQVDGLIVVPAHGGTRRWIADLARSGVPRLVLDREVDIPEATHVLVDHEGGAYEATMHLIGHDRRRVGCIAGPAGLHPTVDRVDGWRRALIETGLEPAALVHVPFGRAHGYRAGRALLSQRNRPDALFVASDEQALGVLRAAAEMGVRVPDDLAICSFDGIEGGAYTVPALSTMRQPVKQLGRLAVEWLVARFADPARDATRIVCPTTLVARGSCGCPDPAGGDSAITEDDA
ncbi:LacI family transcriptional regulator [Micromonospora sp. DR5-3]|nr:LacI family DNA-binding transcriptional regulator [Micromonospora sp. MP36]MCW3819047.1 LacI family transcriptional regulator [Micromonospora sp. DR5-3]